VLDAEVRQVAYQVARRHAGRFRKDTSKNEFSGVNIDTYAKYVHIVNMWFDFCLANAMFTGRWDMCPLSEPRIKMAWMVLIGMHHEDSVHSVQSEFYRGWKQV
jgi:hypothetical protein